MLSLLAAASAFQPSSAPHPLSPSSRRSSLASVQLRLSPSTFEEQRSEAVKAAGISALTGSMLAAPMRMSELIAGNAVGSAFGYNILSLGIQTALFGIIYRTCARSDDNDLLKQGAIGAAAICRALCTTVIPNKVSSGEIWLQLGAHIGESVIVFGGAATALEWAWNRGYATRLPASGLPHPVTGVPEYRDDEPHAAVLLNSYSARLGARGTLVRMM